MQEIVQGVCTALCTACRRDCTLWNREDWMGLQGEVKRGDEF